MAMRGVFLCSTVDTLCSENYLKPLKAVFTFLYVVFQSFDHFKKSFFLQPCWMEITVGAQFLECYFNGSSTLVYLAEV